MNSPDLSDPEIRALLDQNHVPKETKVVSGHDTSRIVETRVACDMCGLPYPCPTRQALRDRVKLVKETQLKQTMRAGPHRTCEDPRPHGEHTYTGFSNSFYCPGTSYEIVDCDDVPTTSHKAHAWRFRGADFWCPGG